MKKKAKDKRQGDWDKSGTQWRNERQKKHKREKIDYITNMIDPVCVACVCNNNNKISIRNIEKQKNKNRYKRKDLKVVLYKFVGINLWHFCFDYITYIYHTIAYYYMLYVSDISYDILCVCVCECMCVAHA